MDSDNRRDQAVELLQELGLKEYEAKSFVALSRMPRATAKDVSETTDVPRTRVYDAIRVLEAKGLAEVQHSNPQLFRAVPVQEAVDTLEKQYESRVETLRSALEGIEPAEADDDPLTQEIWSLNGRDPVAKRTRSLVEEATGEVVLVIGSEELLTDDLLRTLETASNGVSVIVGVLDESLQELVRDRLPGAKVFVSGLDWLRETDGQSDTAIGRLLLVDRQIFLVSSIEPEDKEELAIFGRGFGNGLVVIARRLMATGLVPGDDPGRS